MEKKLLIALTSPTFAELQLEIPTLPEEVAMIEWRRDLFRETSQAERAYAALKAIGKPLIYTLRSHSEGGEFTGDLAEQKALLTSALAANIFSYVDLEIADRNFSELVNLVKATNVKLILSYHNPIFAPDFRKLSAIKKQMLAFQPDIIKFAVYINHASDLAVLKEFGDTDRYVQQIMIGMGEVGVATRLFPQEFASDYSFIAGKKAAAPGQVTMDVMKTFID